MEHFNVNFFLAVGLAFLSYATFNGNSAVQAKSELRFGGPQVLAFAICTS